MRQLYPFAAMALLLGACLVEDPPDGPGGRPDLATIHVIEFGDVLVGREESREAVVEAGASAVFLSPPEVQAPFFSDLQEIVKLEPGSKHPVRFHFRPMAAGAGEQLVELRMGGAIGLYHLRGQGVADETECEASRTDRFADVRPQVDVLLLVDDHPSMEAIREALVEQARALPAWLDAARFDWRLAISSSSLDGGCPGGTLLGSEPILDASTPGAEESLELALRSATCAGSGAGLEAAVKAVQAAGPAFARPEAGLALLVVSTRDDRSPEEVETYTDRLALSRGALPNTLVRALAVVGEPGGWCDLAEPGTRYGAAIARLSGSRRSLCAADWNFPAFFPKDSSFGMKRSWPLGKRPIEGRGIEVRLDGEIVPSKSEGARAWNYDDGRNAVVFRAGLPLPGQTIEITYEPRCN